MATQQKTLQSQELGLSEPGFRQGLSTFRAQIKKQFIVMKRYPIAFITSFAMVFIILMVFILAATLFTPKGAGDDVGIKSGVIAGTMFYGFCLFMFTSDTFWTIGNSMRMEQYQGTLESLFLTPANKFTDLASRITIIVFWTGLNTVLALLLIDYIIADIPFANFETAIIVLLFTLLGTFGIGFFMAGLGIRLKESSELLANMLQFFVLILCAMFFPFSVLPEPVLVISRLIPLSYGVDLFRSTMMGFPSGYPELASTQTEWVIVVAFGIIMPIAGFLFYRWSVYRQRAKSGISDY
ncbi:MAG: ABC transporter permease [Candidatus Heimdallarchaeota archaeon]